MPAATHSKFGHGGDARPLRTLLVDNYDSYTLNLLQLLVRQLPAGASVLDSIVVIRNDQYSWATVRDTLLPHIDSVVISPGPGNPQRQEDFGVCGDLIHHAHLTGIPVLGVCLGHQGIAVAFGGTVKQCEVPVHGQQSPVELVPDDDELGLFDGVPDMFQVVRYHSLAVSEQPGEFPAELKVLARATGTVRALDPETNKISEVESREIMALRHRTRPLFGVQFHPESICSEYGARIMENFGAISRYHSKLSRARAALPSDVAALSLLAQDNRMWRHDVGSSSNDELRCGMRLVHEKVDLSDYKGADVGGDLFAHLYGDDSAPIWLDSANNSGMSVMASAQTPGSITVRYSVHTRRVTAVRLLEANGTKVSQLDDAATFWTWMQGIVDQTRSIGPPINGVGFQCGWIGYFGYEMRHADRVLGKSASVPTMALGPDQRDNGDRLPDAQLTFVDRCIVVDHTHEPPQAHALALVAAANNGCSSPAWVNTLGFRHQDEAADWVGHQAEEIRSWAKKRHCPSTTTPSSKPPTARMESDLSCAEYVDAIARAKQWIAQGESYEICLTTQFRLSLERAVIKSARDMHSLYTSMRRHNPAPYGALLWMGDLGAGVASCSPERFLRTTNDNNERWVEMKPIKGTSRRNPRPLNPEELAEWEEDDKRRAHCLQNDVKERAENLMIVDLIRHDLNWIAHNANVRVPSLMAIESYATVHQMVTTVQAQLRASVGDVGALAHCFPPGSMTGAPKLRTMRLLEELEAGNDRGVYSGCLGYFSAHGQSDWSVVIRTAVIDRGGARLSVGAGGALTILSDAKGEWDEVETKLQSVLPGISQFITHH
ncbi:para-aminobenzoate synthase, (PABA) [Coemansia spiralis]|uniref:aminodeoxychorismate synthase n=1 Tax=Coemansia spiralis TaxID=417178 RepID=A0A9W8L1W4_9FUNG|nr:para-aminobenzoate synthase, (PABA) [Coemansia spiralis]